MKFKLSLLLSLLFLAACKKTVTETISADELVTTEHLSFKEIKDAQPVLADDEDKNTMYARAFNVRNLLSVAPAQNNGFKITNYAPTGFKNLTIFIQLKGYQEKIKLMTIDSVAPLTEITRTVSFTQKDQYYLTESGKLIEITGQPGISGAAFTVVADDPLFKKLKNLKVNWTVNLSIRGSGNSNWWDMNPLHAREYLALFTNMAYLFSSKEFQDAFMAYEGLINNAKQPFTMADKEQVYKQIIERNLFNTGLVKNVNGLGGGNTLGVAEFVLFNQYNKSAQETYFHELGHALGFSHDSNMTYPSADGKSFTQACAAVYNKFLTNKELPFWDYRILNTYKKYLDKEGYLLDTKREDGSIKHKITYPY